MKIIWTKKKDGSEKNITNVVGSTTWGGSIEQAAREATITVLNAPNDSNITKLKLNIAPGDILKLYEGDTLIFYGEVQTSEKRDEIGTVSYKARDLLDHLLRINHKQKFKNKTAEAITKELCKKYGITTGSIVATKKVIKKLIIDDSSLYDIIMTAYTKASRSTGKKYMAYMSGKKLCVKAKGATVNNYELDEYKNLSEASYEETIENMVDQVKIYNDKGKQVGVVKNAAHIKRYGIYQSVYTKEKGVNAQTAAKNMLNGIEKKVNVSTIDGNIKCISGNAVKVTDTATGLKGIFWIQNDSHTWESGRHTMNLELSFKNIMDKKDEEGSEKKKKTGKGGNKSLSGTYTVITTKSIMRAAAGRSAKSVATLKKGDKFVCDGKYEYVSGTAWYHGTSGGKSGYVYSPNVKK
jgi:bifunctional DNA-binding transcriptional regulator/antitoxin component of YhaV-PrlF toxin-antitoxin module|nr:MAG TPA: 43 kDa tail protein [Caudoviricetes sp.]